MTSIARVLTILCLIILPSCLVAQDPAPVAQATGAATTPAATTPIDRITFAGADPYTDTELRRVIQLHTGDMATEPLLTAAVQALSGTGLFADVSADIVLADGVHTLTFKLKPIPDDQLLRVSFANFIWLTPEEIDTALHRAIPLYHGKVGGPGKTADQIHAVLDGLLTRRHIQAAIDQAVVSATREHPYPALEFRVTDPPIRLLSVNAVGGPVALVNAEGTAQKKAMAAPFNQGTSGVTTEDILLAPVRDAGYIGAKLADVKLLRSITSGGIGIIYSARIDAGPQYKVGSVAWSPNPVYSAEDFAHDCELQPGTLPREAALTDTRQAILNAFHKNGYIEAEVRVRSDLNAQNGTVNYTFYAVPGDSYRVSKVSTTGLSAEAQAEFDANFALKPGQVFNAPYVDNFLVNHPALKTLIRYGFSYQTLTNPETHELELTLNFSPAR